MRAISFQEEDWCGDKDRQTSTLICCIPLKGRCRLEPQNPAVYPALFSARRTAFITAGLSEWGITFTSGAARRALRSRSASPACQPVTDSIQAGLAFLQGIMVRENATDLRKDGGSGSRHEQGSERPMIKPQFPCN